MLHITTIILVIIACCSSFAAMAHSEHDKARYVAIEGKDIGKCDQVLRPCKTIAYAVKQANKGDQIRVSAGEYTVNTSDELFYLKSALVPIYGGYNRFDHFQSQSPNTNITRLKNIPVEMAEPLRKQGFIIIADGKSSLVKNTELNRKLREKLSNYYTLSKKQTDLSCTGGFAGNFACNNIDLLAHMPLSQFSSNPLAANDIWGHVDLNNGNEYALIGLRNGIAVVDVTDAKNPKEVGTVSGLNSSWRDIKVYQYFDSTIHAWQAYAYAIIDSSADHVTIIDLNQLPNSVSLVEKNNAVATAHNVYISNVDHTLNTKLPGLTPSLQIVGSNKFNGAFHSYSLANPRTLTPLTQSYFGSGYTHDGASLNITDDRRNSQCQTSDSSCTIFIDFNEKEMKLWNITNASNATLLGVAEYNDVAKSNQYVHSGWGTEDKQYIFLHDEFDEKYGGINSTVRIFSIADLTNPTQVGQWTGPTAAIDHNGFVRGNRYYMSNYERGITVLDISDPSNPVTAGFFDTYTPSDNAGFNGAWGTYPFLPSGNILVSDINSGLYILKDRSRNSQQGKLGFSTNSVSTAQGETLTVSVQRLQASNPDQSVSVNYQLIPGSAQENEDYTPIAGTLTWAANDTANKSINIEILPEANNDELQELFFIRLSEPTNHATLADNSYLSVNIAGRSNNGTLTFTSAASTAPENQNPHNITLTREGSSSGDISITYTVNSDSAIVGEDVEALSGTLNWPDGDMSEKTISIHIINDDIDENNESFTVDLSSESESNIGAISQHTVTISDDDSNSAPIVTLPENSEINTGATLTVTATVSDNENDEMTYLWQQVSGTSVTLNNRETLSTTFTSPNSAGDIQLSFTATDSKGLSTMKSITYSVIAPPVTPPPTNSTESSSGGSIAYLLVLLLIFNIRKRYFIV